jgi:Secretion system C-terminal sorting domain/F5/8 type C domain
MKKIIILIAAWISVLPFGFSQCFPDRHSTNFYDGWISCEAAPNPNPARPVSHFIQYDFGKVYKLGQMTIWNTNDPSHLDWGMRDVAIDYSTDGENWLTAGDFTFPQASGLSTYEGAEGPHLNDIEARYLLITALNNYGGECFGLSEMKVNGEEVFISDVEDIATLECVDISIYPNPFAEKMTLGLAAGCSGDLRYTIYDGSGKMIFAATANLVQGQNKTIEIGADLPAGTYRLYLEYGGKAVQRNIVKMNRS